MKAKLLVVEGDSSIDPDRLRVYGLDGFNSIQLCFVSRDDDAGAVTLELERDPDVVEGAQMSLRLSELLTWYKGEAHGHAANFTAAVDRSRPDLAAGIRALHALESAAKSLRLELEQIQREQMPRAHRAAE